MKILTAALLLFTLSNPLWAATSYDCIYPGSTENVCAKVQEIEDLLDPARLPLRLSEQITLTDDTRVKGKQLFLFFEISHPDIALYLHKDEIFSIMNNVLSRLSPTNKEPNLHALLYAGGGILCVIHTPDKEVLSEEYFEWSPATDKNRIL